MSAPEATPARIPPGDFRELGPLNWVIAKVGARVIRAPRFSLFGVLGRHRLLFLLWGPFSLVLLRFGKLSRIDAEMQAKIFKDPDAKGLTDRQRTLITATDEFVITRSMSSETWAAMSNHYDRRQLIEFCMLAAQYDGLAATIETLRIPLDFPD